MNTDEFNRLVSNWHAMKVQLDHVKKIEAELRQSVISARFGDAEKGTHRHNLDNDNDLKVEVKLSYSLDKDNEKVEDMLDVLAKSGNEGSFVADRIVKWKPELAVSEYNKLSEQHRNIVDTVLTIKPAAPSLDIVPKSKR